MTKVNAERDQGDLPLLEMGLAGSSSAASGGGGDDSAFWANSTEVVAGIGAEVQLVSMQAAARGGTFKLGFRGAFTAPIAFDASAPEVESALEALASVLGDVEVESFAAGAAAGRPAGSVVAGQAWLVTFLGNSGDLPPLEARAQGLVGGGASWSDWTDGGPRLHVPWRGGVGGRGGLRG